jgi:hypothetical protein
MAGTGGQGVLRFAQDKLGEPTQSMGLERERLCGSPVERHLAVDLHKHYLVIARLLQSQTELPKTSWTASFR